MPLRTKPVAENGYSRSPEPKPGECLVRPAGPGTRTGRPLQPWKQFSRVPFQGQSRQSSPSSMIQGGMELV